jgi:hypothetical protein
MLQMHGQTCFWIWPILSSIRRFLGEEFWRNAVTLSLTTSLSIVRCIVRLVDKLCFFDNFRTLYGEFNVPCPKTFEHPSATDYSSLRQDMPFSATFYSSSHRECSIPLLRFCKRRFRLSRSLRSRLSFALHCSHGSLDQLAREGQRSQKEVHVELH